MKKKEILTAVAMFIVLAGTFITIFIRRAQELNHKQQYIYTLVDTAALRREGIILPPHALDAQWFNIVKFQQQLDAIRKIRKHEN